jgi:hypothetical protein
MIIAVLAIQFKYTNLLIDTMEEALEFHGKSTEKKMTTPCNDDLVERNLLSECK